MLHPKSHQLNIFSVVNKAEISKKKCRTEVNYKQSSLHYQNMLFKLHKYAVTDITNAVIKMLRHHSHRYILVYS